MSRLRGKKKKAAFAAFFNVKVLASTLVAPRPEDQQEPCLLPEFRTRGLPWSTSKRQSMRRSAEPCASLLPDREYRQRSCRCSPQMQRRSQGWDPSTPSLSQCQQRPHGLRWILSSAAHLQGLA